MSPSGSVCTVTTSPLAFGPLPFLIHRMWIGFSSLDEGRFHMMVQ
jgi:hypothetical protein